MNIRPEEAGDIEAIRDVNRRAFDADGEGKLVDALRDGGHVRVSLVAEEGGQVLGHILFTHLPIETPSGTVDALALAPMAVLPERQRRGIGSQLVRDGMEACRAAGGRIIIVVGHPQFYPRFGFSVELAANLDFPWPRNEAFMAAELVPGALQGVAGTVEYPPPFHEMGD